MGSVAGRARLTSWCKWLAGIQLRAFCGCRIGFVCSKQESGASPQDALRRSQESEFLAGSERGWMWFGYGEHGHARDLL